MSDKKSIPRPRRDGSGRGIRANRGRGGCDTLEDRGLSINSDRPKYWTRWREALKK